MFDLGDPLGSVAALVTDPLGAIGRRCLIPNAKWPGYEKVPGASRCSVEGYVERLPFDGGAAPAYVLVTGCAAYAFRRVDIEPVLRRQVSEKQRDRSSSDRSTRAPRTAAEQTANSRRRYTRHRLLAWRATPPRW